VTIRVGFTREAEDDLVRPYELILDRDGTDWPLADRASARQAMSALRQVAAQPKRASTAFKSTVRQELELGARPGLARQRSPRAHRSGYEAGPQHTPPACFGGHLAVP
jgi:hypothetical protein